MISCGSTATIKHNLKTSAAPSAEKHISLLIKLEKTADYCADDFQVKPIKPKELIVTMRERLVIKQNGKISSVLKTK
jgi:hypothetical protein